MDDLTIMEKVDIILAKLENLEKKLDDRNNIKSLPLMEISKRQSEGISNNPPFIEKTIYIKNKISVDIALNEYIKSMLEFINPDSKIAFTEFINKNNTETIHSIEELKQFTLNCVSFLDKLESKKIESSEGYYVRCFINVHYGVKFYEDNILDLNDSLSN